MGLGRNLCLRLGIFLIAAGLLPAGELETARELYQRTDYQASLQVLKRVEAPNGATYLLTGQNYFMLGDYKKATEALQKAVAAEPNNSEYNMWLGRAYGRRAETATPLLAAPSANKARQYFETAVRLDPKNKEALDDLFDYYLQAPGFLGGGFDKAANVAQQIAALDTSEGHFAQAQLAEKQKQFATAEAQLRRAVELAPKQIGRAIELAKYLAKQGRFQESDAVFARAEAVAPNSAKLLFAKAQTLIEHRRNLDEARNLLRRYVQSQLTPDDPPRRDAEKLLAGV